jgi:plasmid maintenance system antidote protein VapI
MRHVKKKGIYDYLDSIKILESGNDEEITLARKKYWREYKAEWRRNKRKNEKELTTSWTGDELEELTNAAKKHKVSKTKFIKKSTLAYIDKRYIVPDQIEVRRIAQLLSITYNSIREMMDENALHMHTGKIILEKIFDLERQVLVSLNNPKTIEQLITETINKNPQAKFQLFHLLETIP